MTKKPQTFRQCYPGRFLSSEDLHTEDGWIKPTLTLTDIRREEVEGERGKEIKVIARFRETEKELVLPKINATCLVAMWGPIVKDWIGHRVTLYATPKLMPFPTATGRDRYAIRIYGSPDIDTPITAIFEPPRRKKIPMTMQPTGRRRQTTTTPDPQPDSPDADDHSRPAEAAEQQEPQS